MYRILALFFTVCVFGTPGMARAQTSRAAGSVEETWLWPLPANVTELHVSRGGFRSVIFAKSGAKCVLFIDGRLIGEFYKDPVVFPNVKFFSLDGTRAACVVRMGMKWSVFIDDLPCKDYDEASWPVFSPDGRRVAYCAKTDDKWSCVIDGQLGPPQQYVSNPVFSPDSQRVAYIDDVDDGQASCYVVLDGKTGLKYTSIIGLNSFCPFSPDSKRFAYIGLNADRQSDGVRFKWSLVVDGKPGPVFDDLAVNTPIFSPDSKRTAYVASQNKKSFVVVDNQAGPKYETILGGPVFSPNSARVAYMAVAYVSRPVEQLLILDGQVVSKIDNGQLGLPVFSPDSKRIACAGERAKHDCFMMVDNYCGAKYDSTSDGYFSPDSKRLAYSARQGDKWFIVVNEQRGSNYDGVRLDGSPFSPDGNHLAYAARAGKKWFVVVDGQQGPEYDAVVEGTLMFRPGSVEYVATKDDRIYRVTQSIRH